MLNQVESSFTHGASLDFIFMASPKKVLKSLMSWCSGICHDYGCPISSSSSSPQPLSYTASSSSSVQQSQLVSHIRWASVSSTSSQCLDAMVRWNETVHNSSVMSYVWMSKACKISLWETSNHSYDDKKENVPLRNIGLEGCMSSSSPDNLGKMWAFTDEISWNCGFSHINNNSDHCRGRNLRSAWFYNTEP